MNSAVPVQSVLSNTSSKSVKSCGIVPVSAAKHGVWLIVIYFTFMFSLSKRVVEVHMNCALVILFSSVMCRMKIVLINITDS